MEFPTTFTINWISPFPILGVLGVFSSKFNRRFCKRIVICTVCLCPPNRTLGLYGLRRLSAVISCLRIEMFKDSDVCFDFSRTDVLLTRISLFKISLTTNVL